MINLGFQSANPVHQNTAAETRAKMMDLLAAAQISLPDWVPERLAVEYADCAIHHGVEAANSYVRKLKSESDLSMFSRLISRA